MSVEEDLKVVQSKIAEAQRREAQATYARDAAKEKMEEAVKALKEEFGVSSVTEAKAEILNLEAELQESINRVKSALGDADD